MDDLRTPDTWSPEDEAFLRGALLSLRADVDAEPLPQPAFVRARGDATRRRRVLGLTAGVAAAVVIVGALGFRGLADDRAGPPPLPADPTPTLATNAPTTTSSPTPTATPTPTPTPTATRSATSTPSASPPAVVAPTPTPTGRAFECPVPARSADTSGVPDAAAATARLLMSGAVACDEDALVSRFTADDTRMSFGAGSVSDHMSLPDNVDRYRNLATVLSLPPGAEGAEGYVQWPQTPETDAEWQSLVDAGLITQENVAQMKEYGGYTGWRVVMVAATGQVTAYIAGD